MRTQFSVRSTFIVYEWHVLRMFYSSIEKWNLNFTFTVIVANLHILN